MYILFGIIFLAFIGFIVFYKNFDQEKNKFSVEKRDITRIYSSFLSDVFVDKNDNKIDPINIENIEIDLINFSKRVEKLQKIFIYLQKKVRKIDNLEKREFISKQRNWILDFSIEFVKKLENWINFHREELEKLSETLQYKSDKSKVESYKGNLVLHKKLIENQIEKIKIMN